MEFKNFKTNGNSVHTKIIFETVEEYEKLMQKIKEYKESSECKKLNIWKEIDKLEYNLEKYFIESDSYNDNKITSVIWNDSLPVLAKVFVKRVSE